MLGAISRTLLGRAPIGALAGDARRADVRCAQDIHERAQVRAVTGKLATLSWSGEGGRIPGLHRSTMRSLRPKREPNACAAALQGSQGALRTLRSPSAWWRGRLRRSTMFPLRVKQLCSTIRSHSLFRRRCLSEGRGSLTVIAGFLQGIGFEE